MHTQKTEARRSRSLHWLDRPTLYEVGKGEYIELDPEEIEVVAIESCI
jgi:non-homologous end joining protein Ku